MEKKKIDETTMMVFACAECKTPCMLIVPMDRRPSDKAFPCYSPGKRSKWYPRSTVGLDDVRYSLGVIVSRMGGEFLLDPEICCAPATCTEPCGEPATRLVREKGKSDMALCTSCFNDAKRGQSSSGMVIPKSCRVIRISHAKKHSTQ